MTNNLSLVQNIIKKLEVFGIKPILFGGWAQELLGIIPPREHSDIDLLLMANDFQQVDRFIATFADVTEVVLKRFPHKRAFLYKNVVVEIIIVRKINNKLVTNYWNEYVLTWPQFKAKPIYVPAINTKLFVVPDNILLFYSQKYNSINKVRIKIFDAA